MKILLKGYYGFGNLGDDVLMVVAYQYLRRKFPDAEFFIFSNNLLQLSTGQRFSDYIIHFTDRGITVIDWTYRGHFDLICHGGGGIYFDNSRGGFLYLLRNLLFNNISLPVVNQVDRFVRKLMLKPHRLTYHKRIGIGLGIGTFSKGSRQLFDKRAELGSYQGLMVRDRESYQYLEKYQFSGDKWLGTDLAFLDASWKETVPDVSTKAKTIGIVLSDWRGGKNAFYDEYIYLSSRLHKDGFTVYFFSFHPLHDKKYLDFFKDKENVIKWDPSTGSFASFFTIFASVELVISTRAHGAILAACYGIPSICIEVSQKLKVIHQMLPASSWLISPESKASTLYSLVLEALQDREALSAKVEKDYASNRTLILEFERMFSSYNV